ncbi:MAG: AhpC/TSA family protein [Bacteroidales bacterium]|nr:AhpC/TSA family protein [Bacteroidales bacterium]
MKKLFIAIMVMMVVTSCNSFKINVNLENSNGKTVYLQRYDGEKMNNMDSVVAKDNQAVFKVKKSENTDAFCLMVNGWRRPLTFFADNQDVTIKGDYQNYNGIDVLASESQEKLNIFMKEANSIEDEQEIYYCVLDFVKQNIDNPLGAYALYRFKWAFELGELEKLYNLMPENMQSGYKIELAKYIENVKKTSPGRNYINFTQNDVNGNPFSLSDVVGKSKVIILDFWASWCPDCRKANPELVALYNRLKDKGLDIVSVSLDTDAEKWKKAIADDKLTWKNHVSDLKGWGNEVAGLYTIAFIPQTIIIDANGVILEKNLPFEKMEDLISSTLR